VLDDETAFALFCFKGNKCREAMLRTCTEDKIPDELCKLKWKLCQRVPCIIIWLHPFGKKNAWPSWQDRHSSSAVVSAFAGGEELGTSHRKNATQFHCSATMMFLSATFCLHL